MKTWSQKSWGLLQEANIRVCCSAQPQPRQSTTRPSAFVQRSIATLWTRRRSPAVSSTRYKPALTGKISSTSVSRFGPVNWWTILPSIERHTMRLAFKLDFTQILPLEGLGRIWNVRSASATLQRTRRNCNRRSTPQLQPHPLRPRIHPLETHMTHLRWLPLRGSCTHRIAYIPPCRDIPKCAIRRRTTGRKCPQASRAQSSRIHLL